MHVIKKINYRKDIDGLRAIAVLSVIFFHLGILPNGYLGVDIFFAISGFLITKIVYEESLENHFSIVNFYLRRIRRIIPLVLFTTLTALIIGFFVMLPDDFENLCQSVFATNIFANNILSLITSWDYWAIVNDYKPLIHTWTLGIEEQFYLIYPLIFLLLNGKRHRFILPLLCGLTILSLLFFIVSTNSEFKFYLIQFRFFELSIGGLGAIFFRSRLVNAKYTAILIFVILAILLIDVPIYASVKLFLIVVASVGLLISGDSKNKFRSLILENKVMVGLGKISFSLYMWHQIVFAYSRYFVFDKIGVIETLILFVIILLLSIFSYYIIEQPFRDKELIKTKKLLLITSILFIFICSISYYLYAIGGIVRDVPELELYKSDKKINVGSRGRNIHIEYNAKINDLDKNFSDNEKVKVLLIGNSFARDFANILLESKLGSQIEISYVYDINFCNDFKERLRKAKFVFFSDLEVYQFNEIKHKFNFDSTTVWNIGTKNFGYNNGIFYNKRGQNNYCLQRTRVNPIFFERNIFLKKQWGNNYIDLIGAIADGEGKVPVFTPDCKFISQDCTHLTHAGALYFAKILDIDSIFKNMKK